MTEQDKKPRDWRKARRFMELKRSLVDSLNARGLVEQVFQDKITEYLDFWVLLQELRADIDDRGLTVMDDRGRVSENRSISLALQTSRQMLTIFKALGFQEEAAGGGSGRVDEDEL